MFWFKKKKKEEEIKAEEDLGSDTEESSENKQIFSGNMEAELTKIKSQLEALNEVRKTNSEQFTRISEQIGELRGMLMDSNKSISVIEVASTKAIDMVNSVQPDKLMSEVRKEDVKVETLRANIEANEAMMRDIIREMKSIRDQMSFYKGTEQILKLNEEVKKELIEIKRTEGVVGRHADRVETIFLEVEKKFYDFQKFNDVVKDLERSFKKISSDFDKVRISIDERATKKEVVKLVDNVSEFEKRTAVILDLIDQKSRNSINDMNSLFNQLKDQLEKKHSIKINLKELKVGEKISILPGQKTQEQSQEKKPTQTKSSEQAAQSSEKIEEQKKSDEESKGSKESKETKIEKKSWLSGLFKKKEKEASSSGTSDSKESKTGTEKKLEPERKTEVY